MALKDIEKKLYSPGKEKNQNILSEQVQNIEQPVPIEQKTGWKPEEKKGNKKTLTIVILIIAALIVITGGFYFYKQWFGFSQSKVVLTISAPNTVNSGDEVNYVITVANNNRSPLSNASLELVLPSGSMNTDGSPISSNYKNISLGNINSLSQVQKTYPLRIQGSEESTVYFQAKLSYYAQGLSVSFETTANKGIIISKVPVDFSFQIANQVLSGTSFSFSINYQNNSQIAFNKARIVVDYPQGFAFSSSSPAPTAENNTWDLSNLLVQTQGTIQISGTVSGNAGDVKKFQVHFELPSPNDPTQYINYSENVTSVTISQSPLLINQTVNSATSLVANTGDTLNYVLNYQNNYNVALKGITVKAVLNGAMFNISTLHTSGIYDPTSNAVYWNGTNDPNLRELLPGQKGQETFTISVKNQCPIYSKLNTNLALSVDSFIESDNVPSNLGVSKISQEANLLKTRLATKVSFAAKAYYFDSASGLSNTGPVPPKVGQTTTYTIHWLITDTSNDVKNVQVSAYLMPGVTWLNNIKNNFGGSISYNSSTGEVTWNVGTVPAGSGLGLPTYEAIFQVGIQPTVNQVGGSINILSQSQFSGTDSFTGQSISQTSTAINTNLRYDFQLPADGGTVIQ